MSKKGEGCEGCSVFVFVFISVIGSKKGEGWDVRDAVCVCIGDVSQPDVTLSACQPIDGGCKKTTNTKRQNTQKQRYKFTQIPVCVPTYRSGVQENKNTKRPHQKYKYTKRRQLVHEYALSAL